LAMTQAPIATEIHQALDVELHLATQVAFNHVVAVDDFTDLEHRGVGQLRHAPLRRQINLAHDILGGLDPDAMNVVNREPHSLVGRQIDARDTSHLASPISTDGAERAGFSKSLEGDSAKRNTKTVPASLGNALES